MKQARVDIQALRGLAVLLVVFHHAKTGLLSAGYLGVDIFFVISGFLITGLIKASVDKGEFRFAEFYFRRAKRLLPAAYVTFLATALASPFFLVSSELDDFAMQMIGAVTFTGNLVLWQQTGYFQGAGDLKPLLHVWSLAIEEQYYFILPASLVFVAPRRWLPFALTVLAGSLTLCVIGAYVKPIATFYLLPTRGWELAMGSVGALIARDNVLHRFSRLCFIPALATLLLIPFMPYGGNHPGVDAFVVCLATLLLILRQHHLLNQSTPARLLARAGNFSYSLYLVHWPIFAFANNAWSGEPPGTLPLEIRLIALTLSLSMGYLLYRYVELPVRETELRVSKNLLAKTITASCGLILLTSGIVRAMTTEQHFAEARRFVVGFNTTCQFGSHFLPKPECRNSDQPSILVWGDSYAMHLVPGIAASSGNRGVIQATRALCGPLLDRAPISPNPSAQAELLTKTGAEDCVTFNQSVIDYLATAPSVELVVLSSYFQQYLEQPEYRNLQRSGGDFLVVDATTDAALIALQRTVTAVRALGKRVVVVAPPPSSGFNIGNCLERMTEGKLLLGAPPACRVLTARYHQERSTVLNYLARAPKEIDTNVVSFDTFLCDATACRTVIDGKFIYRDAGHLSYDGSRLLAEQTRLIDQLEALAH